MNSDADIHQALARNLGHVSRQRVRYIQMELRKYATDSRMRNERQFWTILENSGLRFPVRTAKHFLTLIKDQRGIDVEIASKYLKESQKRTRRDSVEALVAGEMAAEKRMNRQKIKHKDTPNQDSSEKDSDYTQLSSFKKMTSRLSLDEFRRVGRMVANVSALTGVGKHVESHTKENSTTPLEETQNNSSPNKTLLNILLENPDKTQDSDGSYQGTNESAQEKYDEKLKKPKMTFLTVPKPEKKSLPTNSDSSDETNGGHGTIIKIEEKNGKKRKKSKRKNQPCVITITVEDVDANSQEKTPTDANEFNNEAEIDSEMENDMLSFLDQESAETSESQTVDIIENEQEPIDIEEEGRKKIDDKKETFFTRKKNKKEKIDDEKIDVNDDHITETELSEINNEEYIENDELKTDPNFTPQQDEQSQNVAISTETEEEDLEEMLLMKIDSIITAESEGVNTEIETEEPTDDSKAVTETVLEHTSTDNEFSKENKDIAEKTNTDQNCINEKDEIYAENEGNDKEKVIIEVSSIAETELIEKEAVKTEHEDIQSIQQMPEKDIVDKDSDSSQSQESLREITNCELPTTESPANKNASEALPTEELTDYSTDSFITSEISENEDSDFFLSSSGDDEETNEVKETECDTKSIADFGGETIYVGSCEMTVFPPEWNNNKEYTDKVENFTTTSEPKLEINWVYGCEISHGQSIASVGDDEIVYGSGCVVVLYNHARYSQRHYLGHSGPISCVAVHPDHSIVGSAQSESKTSSDMLTTASETLLDSAKHESNHGRIHIRVWRVMDLTTMYIMGVGTFQHTIRKMQFMNYKSYILTIENDEEASLTLWDGGCKMKRISTNPNVAEIPEPAVSTGKRKMKNPAPARKPDNGPRGLAATSLHGAEFVIAGKEHLGFWEIKDIDYTGTSSDEEFVKIIGPKRGDFVKHFLPRFVSCCVKAERGGTGLFVTGDTNGTILIWSESLKEVVGGCKHAHECPISCILVTKDHIFTGGASDKKIRAFSWGKRELERVGNLTLPKNIGQVSAISIVGENLFIGTTKNLICTVVINHSGYSFFQSRTVLTDEINKFKIGNKKNNMEENDSAVNNNIFGQLDSREIARGSKEDVKCVCAASYFKKRAKTREMTPTPDESNLRRWSRSAIFRRPEPAVDVRPLQSARTYKPSAKISQTDISRSQTPDGPPKLTIAFASPKLRTSERSLRKAKNDIEAQNVMPYFAQDEFVDKRVFAVSSFPKGVDCRESPEPFTDEAGLHQFFVTASNDCCITIYDAKDHCCVASAKLATKRNFTCMDCCSKRSMLIIGSATGHVALLRLSLDGFEQISETNFRCKRGSRAICGIRFSMNGKRIAFSVGNEIVIASVKSSGIHELERCLGHNSETINSLDWSSERLRGSELLRTTALTPGVWDHFTNHEELSNLCVTDVTYVSRNATSSSKDKFMSGFKSSFSNWRTTSIDVEVPSSAITCCVGDVLGCVRSYHYPAIASYPNETLIRVFHSAVSSFTCIPGYLLACGEEDKSIIQFDLACLEDEVEPQ
ncbi:uncharacterized protein LOC120341887 isoform X2 [Styela clava]